MDALEIKTIRKKLGLTQADFAKKIGVSRDTVINYERGDKIPDSKIEMLNNLLFEKDEPKIGLSPTGYYYPDVTASAGMDLDALRELYGHTSKLMTTKYATVVKEVYRKQIMELSPDF